jgi:hypothetical protein
LVLKTHNTKIQPFETSKEFGWGAYICTVVHV